MSASHPATAGINDKQNHSTIDPKMREAIKAAAARVYRLANHGPGA